MSDANETAGELLRDFVSEELQKEEGRRTSLEARGLAITSVSAGLVAVLELAQKLVPNMLGVEPGGATAVALSGLASLAVSSLLGALTNAPTRLSLIDPKALQRSAPSLWKTAAADVEKRLFASRLVYLSEVQRANDRRGVLLFSAVASLSVAVALFAVAFYLALD